MMWIKAFEFSPKKKYDSKNDTEKKPNKPYDISIVNIQYIRDKILKGIVACLTLNARASI